jgi:GTP-binding protein
MEIKSAQFVMSVVGSHNLIVDDLPQISFVGRSNVGKSSVINKLVNQKKLVHSSSKPGKTQHINFFVVNDDTYFVDLPGYGYAKLGQKYREKLRRLILWYFISGEATIAKVVVIIDAKAGLRDFDREMINVLREHDHPFIIVANKIDKLNQKNLHKSITSLTEELGGEVDIFLFSAKTGRGKEQLINELLGNG